MVSGGTSRGRKRRAFRWFERKPRIPARYPFQRTMIRHCLCAIRNVERERERERVSLSLITGKEHRYGWRAIRQGVGRGRERMGWKFGRRVAINHTGATGWKPGNALASLSLSLCEFVPLWNTSRNSSAIRPKFWNFNSTRGGKGKEGGGKSMDFGVARDTFVSLETIVCTVIRGDDFRINCFRI